MRKLERRGVEWLRFSRFYHHNHFATDMAALSQTKTQDASSTPKDESILQKAARIIPGLSSSSGGGAPIKKTRSRKAKTAGISAPVEGTGRGRGRRPSRG
jgi:hypothetical protein